VTAVDDDFVDGDVTFGVMTGAMVSDDSNYDGQDLPDVTIINIDGKTPLCVYFLLHCRALL
jgi:hypothetical protein